MNTIYELLSNDSINMELGHFDNVVKRISQSAGSGEVDDTKFFIANWMPFVFAALIGFKEGIHRPLSGEKKADVFKYVQINRNSDKLFKLLILNVINLHGVEVLLDRPKIRSTIEEHANGGFDFIWEQISENNNFLHDLDFMAFIREYQSN